MTKIRTEETPTEKVRRRLFDAASHKRKRVEDKEPTRSGDNADIEQIRLGEFNVKCIHCGALHFPEERVKGKGDSFFDCCAHGKIKVDEGEIIVDDSDDEPQREFPQNFRELFEGKHEKSGNFFLNIRKFNSSFAFASFSANRYEPPGRGQYCFKISGQVYHKFNLAAKPDEDELPTNGQLFFLDTEEALEMRESSMHYKKSDTKCSSLIFAIIEKELRERNKYVEAYRMMREEEEEQERLAEEIGEQRPEVKMVFKSPGKDQARTHNLPRENEVAAVFVTDANGDIPPAAVVVHERGKKLRNLSPLDANVEPMLYPLFYPNGKKGWYAEMKSNGKKVTMDKYAKCKLAIRELKDGYFVPQHYGRKLFQQWVVDQYARIEWERLSWVRREQTTLRAAEYKSLNEFLASTAEQVGAEIGRKVILPSSHYGSPRNMSKHFQDSMRIVAEVGKPCLFITYTMQSDDPDVVENLAPGQTPTDRPDLVARVFDLKKEILLDMVCKKGMFGKVSGYVYSVEFQKRGKPHIHLLVSLDKEDKLRTPEQVDKIIKAEIPDETGDPEYYRLVVNLMLHGPCGTSHKKALCMKDGKCDKKFPKSFAEVTTVNEDGKYMYRRRNTGKTVNVRGFDYDNRWVVPHNPRLLKAFRSHVNVEKVADYKAVKYLFKYIFKGYDRANVQMVSTDDNGTKVIKYDEVADFLESRYIGPVEACWRIMGKELQGKSHAVEHLPVHDKNEQVVYFEPTEKTQTKNASKKKSGKVTSQATNTDSRNSARKALERAKETKLTAFFKYCKEHPDEKIKYPDMPKLHTWIDEKRIWKWREGSFNTLGRMYSVSPKDTELFHLRILLLHVESPHGFDELKVFNGITYKTYAEACLARGLIRDDQEWENCLKEAAAFKFPRQLRLLFTTILTECSPAKPEALWEKFKDDLSEDFQRDHTKEQAHRLAYISLNRLLVQQGKSLSKYPSMPPCDDDGTENIEEIISKEEAAKIADEAENKMNSRQRKAYANVKAILDGSDMSDRCIYIDGPAGTGKSFLNRAIYHLAISKGKKVTCMAFMGIAATILPQGRTVHNVFGLPVPLYADSQSSINMGTNAANDLANTDIFIWDEAPSAPRYALEVANKKLQEVMRNNKLFGGKCMVLSGDFRQTLPIKEGGTRPEIVDLTMSSSNLWKHFKITRLKKNMRAGSEEKKFAKQLLKIGNGETNDDSDNVILPEEAMCKTQLSERVFKKLFEAKDFDTVAKRAILAVLNSRADEINEEVLTLLEGEPRNYTSEDIPDEGRANSELPPEVLNTFKTPGLPHHLLTLKENCTVLLMRNLNVQQGLCNGTRLRLTHLGDNVLKGVILTGDKAGEDVLIPRITLKEDKKFAIAFRRHQFPVKLAFGLTCNRGQGQTLDMVGLDLTHQVFTHGQLYVSLSRVKSWARIKIKLSEEATESRTTQNIVFKEVLVKMKRSRDLDNHGSESE